MVLNKKIQFINKHLMRSELLIYGES